MEKINKTWADSPVKTCSICGGYYRGSLEWAHPRCYGILKQRENF